GRIPQLARRESLVLVNAADIEIVPLPLHLSTVVYNNHAAVHIRFLFLAYYSSTKCLDS
ncbi:hypothetical protein COCCADRAFT_91380, partial [Bipolaris zeicola 26-R-13]